MPNTVLVATAVLGPVILASAIFLTLALRTRERDAVQIRRLNEELAHRAAVTQAVLDNIADGIAVADSSGTGNTATITTGATDAIGTALASNFVWSFTTGTIPTVISTNPINGAINIPINRKITATFSEAMNPATVTAAGVFSLTVTTGGAVVPGTATFVTANNTVIFSPTANLLPNTQYTVTISTAAKSAAGNGLAANYVFGFRTGATADLTAPTILSTVPVSAAINVPTNQTITATFSKPMDPSTIAASGTFTVAVAGVGGAPVPGSE